MLKLMLAKWLAYWNNNQKSHALNSHYCKINTVWFLSKDHNSQIGKQITCLKSYCKSTYELTMQCCS